MEFLFGEKKKGTKGCFLLKISSCNFVLFFPSILTTEPRVLCLVGTLYHGAKFSAPNCFSFSQNFKYRSQ